MPSIDDNLDKWGNPESWREGGDDWSVGWGSSRSMWFGSILPRIVRFLPTGHLLELAPGHGRVTEFLLPRCERYTGVDVAELCVETCRRRFSGHKHASFHVGDGKSLPMVAPESIDFAFSWDSLVHVDGTVLEGYLRELATKLRPGASAFLHHSNLGAFVGDDGEITVENPHWRDPSTSAEDVRELCDATGLLCVAQELIQWGLDFHVDCLTVLRRPASGQDARVDTKVFENPFMNEEIGYCGILERHYRAAEE